MKDLGSDFYLYCHNAISSINPQFMNYQMPMSPTSIFNPNATNSNPQLTETEENIMALEQQLQTAKDEQGFIGKTWNGIKNLFGAGTSSKDAESAIEKYKNGQISYTEAQNTINKFSSKQKSATNVFSNVATGLATAGIIAATGVATGGLSLAVLGIGALAGGAVKAGLKTIDRATNEIKGDALDAKQIVKDGLSGAVDGAVTVATCGVGSSVQALGSSAKEAAKIGVTQGIKSGAITGAATGAANYTLDAAFDKDVKFTLGGLVSATAQNAAAGALVGGAVGGVTNVRAYNKFENMFPQTGSNTIGDTLEIGAKNNIIELDSSGNVIGLSANNLSVSNKPVYALPQQAASSLSQVADDVAVIDSIMPETVIQTSAASVDPVLITGTMGTGAKVMGAASKPVVNGLKDGLKGIIQKGVQGFKNLFKGFKLNTQTV